MLSRAETIERSFPLVRQVAGRMASSLPTYISKDDLIGAGVIGLIDAVDKFDINADSAFDFYAGFRIRGAIFDELRALDWVPRSVRKKAAQVVSAHQTLEHELGRPATEEEVALALSLSLTEFQKLMGKLKGAEYFPLTDEQGDAFEVLTLNERREVVAQAIEGLPEKERRVVSMYYYDELTMKEIGEVLGYAESRISQLHTRALLLLRKSLRLYFEEFGEC